MQSVLHVTTVGPISVRLELKIGFNFIALLTLESDIHMGAVCCFSIRSVTLLYQLSACRGRVEVSTWPHSFSIFWHCSNSFLLLR